mmetsp:Transcript_31864/g.81070  ORF Transcript_31864/g.81070 Transcript_31864/m.81070 type:complete len:243 (+) Transcript_31864:3174-3902(+)
MSRSAPITVTSRVPKPCEYICSAFFTSLTGLGTFLSSSTSSALLPSVEHFASMRSSTLPVTFSCFFWYCLLHCSVCQSSMTPTLSESTWISTQPRNSVPDMISPLSWSKSTTSSTLPGVLMSSVKVSFHSGLTVLGMALVLCDCLPILTSAKGSEVPPLSLARTPSAFITVTMSVSGGGPCISCDILLPVLPAPRGPMLSMAALASRDADLTGPGLLDASSSAAPIFGGRLPLFRLVMFILR